MAIHSVYPDQYTDQLNQKISVLQQQFSGLFLPPIDVYSSAPSHYRMRAEFKIWHQDNQLHYAMYAPGEYKKPYIIDAFPVGSARINALMPVLLEHLNASELLKRKLFQVEFLTTQAGEAVVTLIYHKPLNDEWELVAQHLATQLNIHLIGRSRKQKRIIGQDFVTEHLNVNGTTFHYQQVETGFTQPNAQVCEKMLSWAVDCCQPLQGDLLELYCGNGNFTIPLATQFSNVLATEISKTSVNSARYNLELNATTNVKIARMSSEEFSQAMDGVREFKRLQGIDIFSYDFSTIFVDPPRAGLDDHTVEVVQRFENVLYISCNPETLHTNLSRICETHEIVKFAVFDQFPYTSHLECGALLRRKT